MITNLRKLLAYEPAVLAWATSGGLALLLGFVFHATKTEQAAGTTILTAAAAIVTAWKARPAKVSVILGALATAVTAAGAFGFHPSAQVLATITAIGSAVLPLLLRANLTPAAASGAAQHEPEHAAGIVHRVEQPVRLAEADMRRIVTSVTAPARLADEAVQRIAAAVRPAEPVSRSLSDDEVSRVATQVAAAIKPARTARTSRTT